MDGVTMTDPGPPRRSCRRTGPFGSFVQERACSGPHGRLNDQRLDVDREDDYTEAFSRQSWNPVRHHFAAVLAVTEFKVKHDNVGLATRPPLGHLLSNRRRRR
jgi:hypothetical protein